jgi:hypothetical protein
MTRDQAERIGSYVLDTGLDAQILPIERGDRYVVRIQQPQWHCWSFADWNEFAAEQKKQRNKQRRAERGCINPQESYRLAI